MKKQNISASALLVIDMQRYFLCKDAPAFLPPPARLVPNVLDLIDLFRAAGRPVVFTRHAHRRGSDTGEMGRWWRNYLPWAGTRHAELIPEIAPRQGEPVITKTRYSAFEGTRLAAYLRRKRVSKLVICGVMTNFCVETTARHAFMKDFEVIVVSDACCSSKTRYHRASLLNLAYGFARISTTQQLLHSS
ncbi:MAG: isochorismatase family cysteine hydrolase [bacterium]